MKLRLSIPVKAMDDAIGDVIDLYKKYGYWKNTIVIFSSDNGGKNVGGGYNFPLRGEKGGLYEGKLSSVNFDLGRPGRSWSPRSPSNSDIGGIRSVGFVHSPLLPKERRGTVSKNLMHVTDWLPTLMHLGQCQGMDYGGKPLDGVSQVEALWSKIDDKYEVRDEILQYINPYEWRIS